MKTSRMPDEAVQKFPIGYHLNSWDLTGQELGPALKFLSETGFRWFEILAATSLSNEYALKYMELGDPAPLGCVSDMDLIARYAELSVAQREHGIKLSSLYLGGYFTNPKAWNAELETVETLARLIAGFGGSTLVLGGGPPERDGAHSREEYAAFGTALTEIGTICDALGVEVALHPHLDNFVERHDQIDRLVDFIDTDVVGLCIDPAHLVLAGSDPVATLRDYLEITRYFHFKDTNYDPERRGAARLEQFCELGAGVVDLPELAKILVQGGFDRRTIIELDASKKTAEESALESVAYVEDVLGLRLNPGL